MSSCHRASAHADAVGHDPNAWLTPAHHGFRWSTISTLRNGEAVGGSLVVQPDEGLVMELA